MKINTNKLLLLGVILLFSFAVNAQNWSEERAVKTWATVNASAPSITINWDHLASATGYQVYRRAVDASAWGGAIASLSSSERSYEDANVEVGVRYEYRVVRTTNITEPFNGSQKLNGFGYLIAGIQLPAVHQRGKAVVLVADNLYSGLSSELDQLRSDLIGDGYAVTMQSVNVSSTVSDVVQLIEAADSPTFVYLIGQVAYPYSGLYCRPGNYVYPPDGHHETAGGHCGAWIADAYYGSYDKTWTDDDSTTNASRTVNDNLIGDGKFDNMRLPGEVFIQIGRVDLSRLSKFSESELELTRNYLNKAHAYKHGQTSYLRKAIVENNFAAFEEGFSSAAIADFHSHLGQGELVYADLFTSTSSNNYLFSYTCGAGSYQSCAGVGTTDSFRTQNPAIFNHMFGSFFGDYDIANNIGRASLASAEGGLVTAWSGRPKWVTHGLALGENYGASAVRSQNNNNDYNFSAYQNYAHVALLGDPSLRTTVLEPASGLNLSTDGARKTVSLSWTASNDADGYYIYWVHQDQDSTWYLLNQTPVTGTSFTHYTPLVGDNFYMVRATKLETNASGSFHNLSQGVIAEIQNIQRTASVVETNSVISSIYPNPTQGQLIIQTRKGQALEAQVLDMQGRAIGPLWKGYSGDAMDVSHLAPGTYLLRCGSELKRFVKL